MLKKMKSGFSLMEMMIVLLIISIVAAATAPLITKKMTRSAGSGDSPWVFTGDRDNIAFLSTNSQVLVGAGNVPNEEAAKKAKLYIAGAQDWSHIRFGNNDNSKSMGITANPGTTGNNDAGIGISNINASNNSILFGVDQNFDNNSSTIAIGNKLSSSDSERSIVIGSTTEGLINNNQYIPANKRPLVTTAKGNDTIAIGTQAVLYRR